MHANATAFDLATLRRMGYEPAEGRSPLTVACDAQNPLGRALLAYYKSTPPKGRPCDWCGEPVESGKFLHDQCREAERDFYLDIL